MGAAVVGMEVAALIVAVLAFGWPVLVIGAPLLVGTVIALAVVRLWELVRRRLERRRALNWDQAAALPEGLMSGFFAVSAVPEQPPLPPVDVPILRAARGWAHGAARGWTRGAARGWAQKAAQSAGRGRAQGHPPAPAREARRPGPAARPVRRVLALSGRLPHRVRALRRPQR